ncbi:MAG: glycosyltransferase family 2 protein [Candidatus Thorarchaeota archaeon]
MDSFKYSASIVIPAFNEAGSLEKIIKNIFDVFQGIGKTVEVIVVDDGSDDDTAKVLDMLLSSLNDFTVVEHSSNLGKARCLMDGFALATGKFVGFIDADFQFHPKDFSMMMEALENDECDLASGVRTKRKDPLSKRLASKVFNGINGILFRGFDVPDWNSGIKLMRSSIAKTLILGEGYHRLIVPMVYNRGQVVKGYPITHTRREFGESKYGVARLLTGPFDLIALKVKHVVSKRPFTIFGLAGGIMIISGLILGGVLVYEQQVLGQLIGDRPLLILVVLLMIFGFQMFMFGYIAEKLVDIEIVSGPSVVGEVKRTSNEEIK